MVTIIRIIGYLSAFFEKISDDDFFTSRTDKVYSDLFINYDNNNNIVYKYYCHM